MDEKVFLQELIDTLAVKTNLREADITFDMMTTFMEYQLQDYETKKIKTRETKTISNTMLKIKVLFYFWLRDIKQQNRSCDKF